MPGGIPVQIGDLDPCRQVVQTDWLRPELIEEMDYLTVRWPRR
jgi:hypothetical protein